MISVNRISIHFTGTDLFTDVSFYINDRDRIGLTGRNGSGKTTLLRIITGEVKPQEGEVSVPLGTNIGYLPQEPSFLSTCGVLEEALSVFEEALALEMEIEKLGIEMSHREDYDSPEYLHLISRINEADERYRIISGPTMRADTEKVLLGLGFEHSDFRRPVREFSSGWRMRVELSKLLLSKPDVLLLDEPTNHLDIESIQWLEQYLEQFPGAVVLVSHDRAFLDNVTTRTIEITAGKVFDYRCSYSGYVRQREERMEHQMAAFNNQQREIRQIERFIERFRYKSTKARQVQSRIKQLDKMEEVSIDEIDTSAIHFSFCPAPHSGKIVLEAHHLGKNYGTHKVLEDLSFTVIRGDRIAFVGRNGEGKTTLSRIIVKELDHTGTFRLGQNVVAGYYAQNQEDYLDPDLTVFDTVDRVATGDIRKQLRNLLGSFLFSGDTIDKKVKVLSGGEKSRLSLAKLLLTPSNLLVLDEPTNHLDMQSKDVLKNALLQYTGTLIAVSHDRDFLQGLTNKVFEFRNHQIKEYPGDIYDFLESRRISHLKELEAVRKKAGDTPGTVSRNKMNYEKKKQYERELRKLQNQVSRVEEKISQLENEIKEKELFLSNPPATGEFNHYNNVYKEYNLQKAGLDPLMREWEELQQRLEEFELVGKKE